MEKSNLNSRREFLQKLLTASAVAGFFPYIDTVSEIPLPKKEKGKLPLF
jgi:hypothetical protein